MADWESVLRKLLGLDVNDPRRGQQELQEMLESFLEEARRKRAEVNDELGQMRAEAIVLGRRRKASAEQVRKWGERAEAALRQGDGQQAREHLRRQRSFEDVTADWERQASAQEQGVQALEQASRQLASGIAEAETRLVALVSRHKAATAAARVEGLLQRMGEPTDPHPGYKVAEVSVDAEEAWAKALAETSAATVEKRLRALQDGEQEAEIERRLAEMRERVEGKR